MDEILCHQGLFYVPEIVKTELISKHHNNSLVGYFGIKKTRELIAQKYDWPTLCHNVEANIIGYDVYLDSKAVGHKLYSDLQLLSVSKHWWKNL